MNMRIKLAFKPRKVPLWTLLTLTLGLHGCITDPFAKPRSPHLIDMQVLNPTNLPLEYTFSETKPDPNREFALEKSPNNVKQVVGYYDKLVRNRLMQDFKLADVPYPSARLALLGFKKERRLELWGGDTHGPMKRIKSYPFTAFSGELGPKRRQGDRQIPEGMYRITFLNPNSSYHLSMKLDYPNEFDRAMAEPERRHRLGGDIFIHGDNYSIGCIALGDRAIEELFVLTAWAGLDNVQVIVSPYDLRRDKEIRPLADIPWTRELYARIQDSLLAFHP
ncbi:MAG: L,D-transpeptidase family protein [Magnetococcales bacterium]|nr:L,D-transpeptidase family protein [Magnetococcales bacterium]